MFARLLMSGSWRINSVLKHIQCPPERLLHPIEARQLMIFERSQRLLCTRDIRAARAFAGARATEKAASVGGELTPRVLPAFLAFACLGRERERERERWSGYNPPNYIAPSSDAFDTIECVAAVSGAFSSHQNCRQFSMAFAISGWPLI